LPFPDGNRLMALGVFNRRPGSAYRAGRLSWNAMTPRSGDHRLLRQDSSEILATYSQLRLALLTRSRVWDQRRPSAGFLADEEHFGGPTAVLISDLVLATPFGADERHRQLRLGQSSTRSSA
jgi:hypothetical protein